jgi:hypothetical protein
LLYCKSVLSSTSAEAVKSLMRGSGGSYNMGILSFE